jgi:hypothetical protein
MAKQLKEFSSDEVAKVYNRLLLRTLKLTVFVKHNSSNDLVSLV